MNTTEKKPYETPTIQVYELEIQPILMQATGTPPPKADGYDGWTE